MGQKIVILKILPYYGNTYIQNGADKKQSLKNSDTPVIIGDFNFLIYDSRKKFSTNYCKFY